MGFQNNASVIWSFLALLCCSSRDKGIYYLSMMLFPLIVSYHHLKTKEQLFLKQKYFFSSCLVLITY